LEIDVFKVLPKITEAGPKPETLIDKNEAAGPGESFSNLLTKSMDELNSLQTQKDVLTQKLVTGETEDIHSVMLAAEKAEMALQLAVRITNQVIRSYEELMRLR